MKICSSLNRLSLCPIPRITIVTLIALAWSSIAFCGEIHDAAKAGDCAKVKALLKDNPELVSRKDDDGATPLHIAAKAGSVDVAKLLLANKADANAKANIDLRPPNPGEVRWPAVMDRAHKVIVNVKDGRGVTPLHLASINGNKDLVELLLTNKADVNAKDKYGETPLHMTAGRKDVAALLLANKADVNAKDDDDAAPLHRAVANVIKGEGAEFLLAKGADVNARDSKGETPLHWVVIIGRKDLAELLLSRGADVNVRNNRGKTPLQLAYARGHKEAADLLLQHGAHE